MVRTNTIQTPDARGSWLAILDDYHVQFLVLDRESDRDLLAAVQADVRWSVELEDGPAMLFVRSA